MALSTFDCAICNNGIEETLHHLFFQCSLALDCWTLLQVQSLTSGSVFDIIESLKFQLNSPIFMSLIILLCWTIWITRNDLIFQGIQPSMGQCRNYLRKELTMLLHRVNIKQKLFLEEWIISLGWFLLFFGFSFFWFFVFRETFVKTAFLFML